MEQNTTIKTHISVVIPVLNELEIINATIHHVRAVAGDIPVEIIVADGGDDHMTLNEISDAHVLKVESPPGRGCQMNAGAALASGDILLFLHADTELPDGALAAVASVLTEGAVAGAFRLSIDSPKPVYKVVAWFANLRSRLERVPYGDQAQFIRADIFRDLGGFAEIPIMEDVELFRRLRSKGLPIVLLPGRVKTSSRRWDNEGVLRRTLANWWLRLRYRFGVSPETLAHHYRPHGYKADDS